MEVHFETDFWFKIVVFKCNVDSFLNTFLLKIVNYMQPFNSNSYQQKVYKCLRSIN